MKAIELRMYQTSSCLTQWIQIPPIFC